MKIVARGWSRNMGNTVIADIPLSGMTINRKSLNKGIHWNTPGLFDDWSGTSVAWGQDLRLTGSYRLQLDFSSLDVIKLFKARFGSELTPELLERHGFTVSPEFEKAVLSKVKLTDVTLGDLVKMAAANTDEAPKQETSQTLDEPDIRRLS